MLTLSERLRKAMDEVGCKQADLARACRVKPSSVSDWLAGKTKTLQALPLLDASDFLGVAPRWLASGVGPMRTQGDFVAAEAEVRYRHGQWPFKNLSSADWHKVPGNVRAHIESYATYAVWEWLSQQSGDGASTA